MLFWLMCFCHIFFKAGSFGHLCHDNPWLFTVLLSQPGTQQVCPWLPCVGAVRVPLLRGWGNRTPLKCRSHCSGKQTVTQMGRTKTGKICSLLTAAFIICTAPFFPPIVGTAGLHMFSCWSRDNNVRVPAGINLSVVVHHRCVTAEVQLQLESPQHSME